MKTVIVTTIRNEGDILEVFVRYHLQIVDHMIIINHRSIDSSAAILQNLKNEGLPIEFEEEKSLELQQGPFLTRLMRKAVEGHGADWVIPLDADEFITTSQGGNVRNMIQTLPQEFIVKVPWRTYVPLPTDNFEEPDILQRIRHYQNKENQNLYKILIPRPVALKRGGIISAGNHGFIKKNFFKQKEFKYIPTEKLVLAHFPVRSSSQIISKALVGWLACLAKPNKQPTENFHLKLLYDRVKRGDQIPAEELTSMALDYATTANKGSISQNPVIYKPLIPEAGNIMLRYTSEVKVNPLLMLAEMAEEFAETLAATKKEIQNEMNG